MAYADHSQTSSRSISFVIVVLIHVVLGYAFVSGLGIKYVKKAAEQLNVIDVKEEPPPPDEPPPPPPKPVDVPPPPVVMPPPIVKTVIAPPVVTMVREAPPPVFQTAAPPPPPPPGKAVRAKARGRPQEWVSNDDYPARALREEREGVVGYRLDIGTDGRVENCTVTSSSGSGDLDEATCRLVSRRGRFSPAENTNGQAVADTWSATFRWQFPRN